MDDLDRPAGGACGGQTEPPQSTGVNQHHPRCYLRVMGSGDCTCRDELLADRLEEESW